MARVGSKNYEQCLKHKYAKEMDFTGKVLKGMIYVVPEGIESDADLAYWVRTCISFVESLPPKKQKRNTV